MSDTYRKIFFDFWPMIDNPKIFPFFSVLVDDGESLLVKNLLARDIDIFTWISRENIDFSVIGGFAQKDKIIIEYSEDAYKSKQILNLPNEYEVAEIESAVIYENDRKRQKVFPEKPEYVVERASAEDFKHLIDVHDSAMRHQYIQQICDAFNDKSGEVYVLKHMQQSVCFLVLTDSVSAKFNYRYKHISNIFTIPEYRHKGFALYLIKWILNLYQETSFLYVADSLHNEASNRLAKASGFNVIGYNRQVQIKSKEV